MEKYTMLMDWKNQYSENEYTTQSNLQIQCNPYQATNGIFHRTRTNNFKICMEIQKTSNSQSNLEKEEWNWKNQYSEHEYTTQSNLQIQCNPYQATNGIFHRARTNNFTIFTQIQKTSNSQSNLEKKEWNWRNQPA